jgi:hypothetical protein
MMTRARYGAGAAFALTVVALGACILADPPAELPIPPTAPIRILREDVYPPISLLTALPPEFVLPVIADTRQTELTALLVVDLGLSQLFPQQRPQSIDGSANVYVPVPRLVSPDECHTLEVRISYPDLSGADSVTWFYSPTGSFTGCPVFDAGAGDGGDAASSAEGGEGG